MYITNLNTECVNATNVTIISADFFGILKHVLAKNDKYIYYSSGQSNRII